MPDEKQKPAAKPFKTILLISVILGVSLGIFALCADYGLTTIDSSDIPMVNYAQTNMPESSEGGAVANEKGIIDFSNLSDGYIMAKYLHSTDKLIKVQVEGPNDTKYIYDILPKCWATFPLSAGNGKYKVKLFEQVKDSKYRAILETNIDVNMRNEFEPFIRSNQYVNYEDAPAVIVKSNELCKGATTEAEKLERIYNFVIDNFTYDENFANTVEPGYIPDLDAVLEKKSGICFDYAALTTAMLRVQGIPCKLVIGYAGDVYHAWIRVYLRDENWIGEAIYFNGNSWHRMDPTFVSTSHNHDKILEYINDDKNYTIKYFY